MENTSKESNEGKTEKPIHFIHQIVEDDIRSGKNESRVHTRFPPEPNGYLHIGHAKSICLNFGTAAKYNGFCNLRFDDTNPVKEDTEYVDSIKEDVRWLGFNWNEPELYASDYFDKLYEYAEKLVKKGKAYVCGMTAEEMSENRGTPTIPGKESPSRNTSVEENLVLLTRMKNGEFKEGEKTLRAKIDMSSPNMHMRDPVLYRIIYAEHHRTGNKWCIYPMYDFAHGQCDSIEGITHSICTLEFEVHRPLYDWLISELEIYAPQQIEFARLNLNYTVMSKRKLLELVKNNYVTGWDDPRMPTICGLRRRGFTPEAIRTFTEIISVAKRENMVDFALLEHCVREDLNKRAFRIMGVLNPVKVIIDNFSEEHEEWLDATNNPEDESAGKRKVPFTKELYIEQEDFMENPPKKYFRLSPGSEVRLRYAFFIKCTHVVKNEAGKILEIHCTYDPASRGGNSPDGRKVQGTLHWVSIKHAIISEVRLYDRLFIKENPDETEEGKDYKDFLNPNSLEVINAHVEPYAATADRNLKYQFERIGYFCFDKDSSDNHLVFNRTVTLKESWNNTKGK